MRVTDVFVDVDPGKGSDEALWAQLSPEPVLRADVGYRQGFLVADIELAPGVDPRRVVVRQEVDAFALVYTPDRSVLCRVPLDVPVGRASMRRRPNGLSVTAPPAGPAPVAVSPVLRPVSRLSSLRAALAALGERVRTLFSR